MKKDNLLSTDLDYILESISPHWNELKNQSIFITGGTGFFGCWLLESLIWVIEKLHLNTKITVLTRDAETFKNKYPQLANYTFLNFHIGDIKNFIFPEQKYSHIIHAAADTAPALYEANPLQMLDTLVQGTRHTLEFAKHCGSTRYLFISSGAVYGKQPHDLSHIAEEYEGHSRSTYGIGKCSAEQLCELYQKQYGIAVKIARCFAFVGPYLPLDTHFAIGNFLQNAIKGQPIIVNGDGTPYRSYLYTADLTVWLWKILFCGEPLRPYNVGSNDAISIAELAHLIAKHSPKSTVIIKNKASEHVLAERYVPDTIRAQTELGLRQKTSLTQAIDLTLRWHFLRAQQT